MGTSKFITNSLYNPKIDKDIIADTDAVYGYVSKKGSSLEQFDIDWTNAEDVAKARASRLEYLEAMEIKKSNIASKVENYLSEGLEALYKRNIGEYGRKEGLFLEFLYKNGSYEAVIYSSVRVNQGMNVLLGID